MATDTDSNCRSLPQDDDSLIALFSKFEELRVEGQHFDELLKDGFFNLSKARYSMGNKSVGPLQYNNAAMTSLITVETSTENNFKPSWREPVSKNSCRKKVTTNIDSSSPTSGEGPDSTLRKRNVATLGAQTTEDEIPLEEFQKGLSLDKEDETTTIDSDGPTDPIRWFGILVPGALRQGQANFKEAINAACRLASLQSELTEMMKDYQLLKEGE